MKPAVSSRAQLARAFEIATVLFASGFDRLVDALELGQHLLAEASRVADQRKLDSPRAETFESIAATAPRPPSKATGSRSAAPACSPATTARPPSGSPPRSTSTR